MDYIFGPFLSRRLGLSLGIDIVPYKTCSYDCIYCQLGRTTNKTITRKSFFSSDKILSELKESIKSKKDIDYITFSGSGEPTLNKDIGLLIEKIKNLTDIPVAVLTNGSLIFDEKVQSDLMKADIILPSLDAGNVLLFRYINRPHEKLKFDNIIDGLTNFRNNYRGQIWLEVFLVGGVNTPEEELIKIKNLCIEIKPDKIHLNTAERPTTEDYVFTIDKDNMNKIKKIFGENTEIISHSARYTGKKITSNLFNNNSASISDICSLLNRRPCTLEDISNCLNVKISEVLKVISLLESKNIKSQYKGGNIYYYIRSG